MTLDSGFFPEPPNGDLTMRIGVEPGACPEVASRDSPAARLAPIAPALLVLLGRPPAQPAGPIIVSVDRANGQIRGVTLRCPHPGRQAASAISLAKELVRSAFERPESQLEGLIPVGYVEEIDAITAAIPQRRPDGRPSLHRGRRSLVRTQTLAGRRARISAQEALTMAVLRAGLLAFDSLLARGEVALPFDGDIADAVSMMVTGDYSPCHSEREPLIVLLDPGRDPNMSGPKSSPTVHSAVAAVARCFARSGLMRVAVCPWYRVRFDQDGLVVLGPLGMVRDGAIRWEPRPAGARPAALYCYPLMGLGWPGSTVAEVEALGHLDAMGVVTRPINRLGILASLLRAARYRGLVTNSAGPESSLWRKDTLEFAMRTLSRRRGIVPARPFTIVATGENVPAAVSWFSSHERMAIVKPVGAARGEGIVIVRPGDNANFSWPHRRHVVQELIDAPFTLDGVKADLRAYVLLRSDDRAACGLVGPVLLRRASSEWRAGEELSELTNTAVRHRLGLHADVAPLEDFDLGANLESTIREQLRGLADTCVDAAQTWMVDPPAPFISGAPVVQLWGIDALLYQEGNKTRLGLLEVNIYPQLFRGAARADRAVSQLLAEDYLGAVESAVRRQRTSASSLANVRRFCRSLGTLLTTRRDHPTTQALQSACAQRGLQLIASEEPILNSRVVFHWGLDRQGAAGILTRVAEWCSRNAASMINGVLIDKWRQLETLYEASVPVPRSWYAKSQKAAEQAAYDLGYPLVVKPLWGSYGHGVRLVDHAAQLIADWHGPAVVQTWIPEAWQCTRVLVVDGQVVSAITRSALDGRIATYDHGRRAHLSIATLDDRVRSVATGACEALGIEIGGVDIVVNSQGPFVLEVNHRGVELHLAALHGADAIDRVADFLAARASIFRMGHSPDHRNNALEDCAENLADDTGLRYRELALGHQKTTIIPGAQ